MVGNPIRETPEPLESLATGEANAPLRICVTEAGRELLALRALARQAIPMLQDADGYCCRERQALAQLLAAALLEPEDGMEEELGDPFGDENAPKDMEADDGAAGEWLIGDEE